MVDFILITGDRAMFNSTFGPAIVTVRPGNLFGTGKDKINQKLVCVEGDEKKVMVPAMQPLAPSPIPDATPQYNEWYRYIY